MQGQSHVDEPSVNLGDSKFSRWIGGPDFLIEQMNDFKHDGRITNSSGKRSQVPAPSTASAV
jgi:hypothetical protein